MLIDVDEDVQLDAEVLGDADAPAVLLIAGSGWSRDWWDDDLCARLVARGRRVIRYDHRDTGGSTSWPAGAPGYTGRELFTDAVAVLDAFGVDRAHVVGLSLGGGIAQELGLEHRDRVVRADPRRDHGDRPDGRRAAGRHAGDAGRVRRRGSRPGLVGPRGGGDGAGRGRAALRRSGRLRRGTHARDRRARRRPQPRPRREHDQPVVMDLGPTGPAAMEELAGLPVLVVHGTADPLFPVAHGRALAAAIPGARLLEIEGMGHQLPPEPAWDRLVDAMLDD